MFKKILICAVSMIGLVCANARADEFYPMHRHPAYAHSTRMHSSWHGAHYWRAPGTRIHPTVIRGYYGPGFASDVPYRGIDRYAPLGPQAYPPPTPYGVYNQPIVNNTTINNTTINNTSFNGGPGGVVAKPTNADLVAAKEPRVQATALQVNQARAAGMRSEQFVSTNRGKPPVAATARAGEFKGKGVVPATAAGKAALATPAAPAPLPAPAPNGNVLPETKEKPPIGEKPVQPGLPPTAPKLGEKPPAAEKLVTPEAAPPAPKPEPKPPAVEKLAKPEAAPPPPKVEPKPPAAEKVAKPEIAPSPPKIEERRPPVVERPARPAPPPAAQRAVERPPAPVEHRPAQPQHKPEAKECGRPGLPPCPR